MTLINCPRCHQKVLSLASTCPKCGFSFSEQRKKDEHSPRAKLCKTCRREIAPSAPICPHCGEMGPVRRPASRLKILAMLAVGLAAAVFLIILSVRQQPDDSEDRTSIEQQPVEMEMAAPTQPSPVIPESAQVTAPTILEPEPEPPAAPLAVDTLTRWTANWANVREARDPDAEILRVLRPGQMVQVAELERGWWAVHLDGRMIGYVARSLIVNQPPESEPDTAVPAFRLP